MNKIPMVNTAKARCFIDGKLDEAPIIFWKKYIIIIYSFIYIYIYIKYITTVIITIVITIIVIVVTIIVIVVVISGSLGTFNIGWTTVSFITRTITIS